MVSEFQLKILQFALQHPHGKEYIPLIQEAYLDSALDKNLLMVIKKYYEVYRISPTKADLLQSLENELKKAGEKGALPKDVLMQLRSRISEYFSPLVEDTEMVKKQVLIEQKKALTKDFLIKNSTKVDGLIEDESFNAMEADLAKIISLSPPELNSFTKKPLRFSGEVPSQAPIEVHPCCYPSINDLTARKGFYSPQLIILMGGPKAFKTGFLLNMTAGYLKSGLKVKYCDTENGVRILYDRLMQTLLGYTIDELNLDDNQAIIANARQVISRLSGGDVSFGFYGGKGLKDVDADIRQEYLDTGFKPDVIIHDYIDKYKNKEKDKRISIQENYDAAVRLNEKWGTFSFTVSTVKRTAINKEIVKVTDFGEDIMKAYNCHAAFALCRTTTEESLGMARIVPVIQREGAKYSEAKNNQVIFKLNEERMIMEEFDPKEALKNLKKTNLTDY